MDLSAELLAEVDQEIDGIRSEPELAAASHLRQAENARAAEAELLEQIRFERRVFPDRRGHAYHELFDDLWVYGWKVVRALLRTNRMSRVVRQYAPYRQMTLKSEDLVVLAHSAEQRDQLALDVIIEAIPAFEHNVLTRQAWSPSGGASLRTWFIGTCALVFPRIYDQWSQAYADHLYRLGRQEDIDWGKIADKLADSVAEPSTFLLDRTQLRSMFVGARPMTVLIFAMIMHGLSPIDISARLGLSRKSVELRMYHFRQKALERQEEVAWRALLSGTKVLS